MKGKKALPATVLSVAASAVLPAHAQNDDWRVTGANTVRVESYNVRGDRTSGPYPFRGGQYYDEFAINAFRQLSAYDNLRLQLYGVANDSDYRSLNRGFVPERINLTRENGDTALPYRLELGDYFSAYSFRSLQRGLRGAQLELQPQSEVFGARHSLLLTAGVNQLDWRHLRTNVDEVTGASWLMDFDARTRISANIVQDFRYADVATGTPDRKQSVVTTAASTGWDWGRQKLRFEGEIGSLSGDHSGYADATGATLPDSGIKRHGVGRFAQVSGLSTEVPFDYRMRHERYDRNYRPANAVVLSDHSADEMHLGWRFANGLAWRTRLQRFADAMQSSNALHTSNYGTNLSGPLGGSLSGTADLFWQDILKPDRSVDQGSLNLNAGLSRPLPDAWMGNLGVSVQQVHNRVPGAADMHTEQLQLSGSHALRMGRWLGSLTPGIRWRQASGDMSGLREWAPQLAFTLASGGHSIAASYGYQKLVPNAATAAVVDVNALRLDYRFSVGQHTFGVEASAYDRRVTIGQFNDTYRLSLYWTYNFERPPARVAATASPMPAASALPMAALSRTLSLLAQIAPGASLERALSRLSEAGIQGGRRQGNNVIFEVRLLDELTQRQRLVVESEADQIQRVALLVDLPEQNNAGQVVRDYEQVRRAMLDRFGQAMLSFEDGAIGPSFVADLNMNRVIRIMQWTTPSGMLRLGIPRRLDGQARIEIQHAARLGPPREALWSVESVQ